MVKRKYSKLIGETPLDTSCPVPTIHNIVSTGLIESATPIDLTALALILPYSFYDRQRFAAITIRLRSPDCTPIWEREVGGDGGAGLVRVRARRAVHVQDSEGRLPNKTVQFNKL
jgi:hypothetical protein